MFSMFTKSNNVDISIEEFKQKIENEPGVVIDVRTKQEYDEGHLSITEDLIDFNSGEFHRKVDELEKEKTYYLYCRSGNRSGQAARIMQQKGFKKAYNVGGYEDLAASGFATE